MSVYGIHSFCRRILHDREFRSITKNDPDRAVAMMPLTDAERAALRVGDVRSLQDMGASGFLLLILSRFEVLGLDLPTYNARMRAEHAK
jgi:hypothetical protein